MWQQELKAQQYQNVSDYAEHGDSSLLVGGVYVGTATLGNSLTWSSEDQQFRFRVRPSEQLTHMRVSMQERLWRRRYNNWKQETTQTIISIPVGRWTCVILWYNLPSCENEQIRAKWATHRHKRENLLW